MISASEMMGEFRVGMDHLSIFDPDKLDSIAELIPKTSSPNVLEKHKRDIKSWISRQKSRGVETISLVQLVDSISNEGCPKETAEEISQLLDIEGSGVIDLDVTELILNTVSQSESSDIRNDITIVNKLFQKCYYAPGFLDAFTEDGQTSTRKMIKSNHGQRLFKFLFRNRVNPSSFVSPTLSNFTSTTEKRLHVLRASKTLKEEKNESFQLPKDVPEETTDCISSVQVSSNFSFASNILDNDTSSYWRSNGPSNSHWVRLHIRPNIRIHRLSMYVSSDDHSYRPKHVVVYGGQDEENWHQLNDVEVPDSSQDLTILEGVCVSYRYIKITVLRCHTNGKDTTIRRIKATGYRTVEEEEGKDLFDAGVVWCLTMLADIAQATLPVAPGLRESIIKHTQLVLRNVKPLSLSSSAKPRSGLLSPTVVKLIGDFLKSIVFMKEPLITKEIVLLLEIAFVGGQLCSILAVVEQILPRLDMMLPAESFLQRLKECGVKYLMKGQGDKLNVSVLACDGGAKDDITKPSMVLSDDIMTNNTYFPASGKTKCAMVFQVVSRSPICLRKVVIKFGEGESSGVAKSLLVFVCESNMIASGDGDMQLDWLSKYDEWTVNDYEKVKGNNEKVIVASEPVAFFTAPEAGNVFSVTVEKLNRGDCIVVKFLGLREENAERLSISKIEFLGYEENPIEGNEKHIMYPQFGFLFENFPEGLISGELLVEFILKFLYFVSGGRDISKTMGITRNLQCEIVIVDMNELNVEHIWNMYDSIVKSKMSATLQSTCLELLLRIFYISLPHLSTEKELKSNQTEDAIQPIETDTVVLKKSFRALCDIVDQGNFTKTLQYLAKLIICNGAEVFFPDEKERKNTLLHLAETEKDEECSLSESHLFESLCRHYTTKDTAVLLGLSNSLRCEDIKPENSFSIIKAFLLKTVRENNSQITESEAPSDLVRLMCAMQDTLLRWCHTFLSDDNVKEKSSQLFYQYVELLCSQSILVLQSLEISTGKVDCIERLQHSFLALTTRHFVLYLDLFSDIDIDFVKIIQQLYGLLSPIRKLLAVVYPPLQTDSDISNSNDEGSKNLSSQKMLNTWNIKSSEHTNTTEIFTCTGCKNFRVAFEKECQTNNQNCYLEFIDSSGVSKVFHTNVGTDFWPKEVLFDSPHQLSFRVVIPDNESTCKYEFKVFALGSSHCNWLHDLQLNITRYLGILCGKALNAQTTLNSKTNNGEQARFLQNELLESLFRGGYMVGKLERSLSGFHKSNPFDSTLNSFLFELARGDTDHAKKMLTKCRSLYKGQYIGGSSSLNEAVNTVFAALLWHTQELRMQVHTLLQGTISDIPSDIMAAYTSAESVRKVLMEKRQRLVVQFEEKNANGDDTQKDNPDAPIISCQEKALLLLRFAGLTKIEPMNIPKRRSFQQQKSLFLLRQENLDSPHVPFAKKKAEEADLCGEVKSYPSFQMIIGFVTNDSLTYTGVQEILRSRCTYAKDVSTVYNIAHELLLDFYRDIDSNKDKDNNSTKTNSLQLIVLFLQNMLSSQQHFSSHYAEYLNGCGLELEKNVRKSFYSFLERLLDIVERTSYDARIQAMKTDYPSLVKVEDSSLHQYILSYSLHFMDMEWRPYDYSFLKQLQFPSILTQNFNGMKDLTSEEEKAELEMLERHKEFSKKVADTGLPSFIESHKDMTSSDTLRDRALYVARSSFNSCITVECNSCQGKCSTYYGHYRCLHCMDVDLCKECYVNGAKPGDSYGSVHDTSHPVVKFQIRCDGCQPNLYIVDTRMKCQVCFDFDLCLSCYRSGTFPSHHTLAHSVTKMKIERSGCFSATMGESTALKTYIQHHAWLQYSAIMLYCKEAILDTMNDDENSVEYKCDALKLLLMLLRILVKYISPHTISGDMKEELVIEKTVTRAQSLDSMIMSRTKSPGVSRQSFLANFASLEEVEEKTSLNDDLEMNGTIDPNKFSSSVLESTEDDICAPEEPPNETEDAEKTKSPGCSDGFKLNSDEHQEEGAAVPSRDLMGRERERTAEIVETDNGEQSATVDDKSENSESVNGQIKESSKTESADSELMCKEKVIGLIGAIIPHTDVIESQKLLLIPEIKLFFTKILLPVLCEVVGDDISSHRLRIVSLGVMNKILSYFGPGIGDIAVGDTLSAKLGLTEIPGTSTVKFLFSLGSSSVAKANLHSVSAVDSSLKFLSANQIWTKVVATYTNTCLSTIATVSESPLSLFSLMFVAGFPNILHSGSLANHRKKGGEVEQVLVVDDNISENKVSVMNMRSRKHFEVEKSRVDPIQKPNAVLPFINVSAPVEILKSILPADPTGLLASVSNSHMLCLVLKGLLNIMSIVGSETVSEVIQSGLVPQLIHIACQGTGFAKQWLLQDLEVLIWKLRQLEISKKAKEINELKNSTDLSVEGQDATDSPLVTSVDDDSQTAVQTPLDDLDEETRLSMKEIHESLQCSYPILRAIYEFHGQNRNRMLEEVQNNVTFDDNGRIKVDVSNEIRELSMTWEDEKVIAKSENEVEKPEEILKPDPSIDIGLVKHHQNPKSQMLNLKANKEVGISSQIFRILSEEDSNTTIAQNQSRKSAELLKQKMETISDDIQAEMKKINDAIAILCARKLVGWILASWPESEDMATSLYAAVDPQDVVGLLELLQSSGTQPQFGLLLQKLIECCGSHYVESLALSAVNSMYDIPSAVVCESKHKYETDDKIKNKITVDGASTLLIQFDPMCCTEEDEDELIISSSSDFSENRKTYSGKEHWEDVSVPGDTVYYKFTCESGKRQWGWRFSVTNATMTGCGAGCDVLNSLLSCNMHNIMKSLPLDQLWTSLVMQACKQVGRQRIIVIGLLLAVLQVSMKQENTVSAGHKSLNLVLLRPLWQLYNSMIVSKDVALRTSPVSQALSELFLLAENAAQARNEAADLIVGLADGDKIKAVFTRVVREIAAFGCAIDLTDDKVMNLLKMQRK